VRRGLLVVGVLLGVLVNAGAAAEGAVPAAAVATPSSIGVALDRASSASRIGDAFAVSVTVRNGGDAPMAGLIAHLNVLSTDPGTYVDPEDWSSERTRYLPPLGAHATSSFTVAMQAVNQGGFLVYVAVMAPDGSIAASPPMRVSVAAQRSLDPAGAAPVVAAVPLAVLGLLVYSSRRRRRRA
jgi:hypothetical protein